MSLQYDFTSMQFGYNLQTPKQPGTCCFPEAAKRKRTCASQPIFQAGDGLLIWIWRKSIGIYALSLLKGRSIHSQNMSGYSFNSNNF